MEEKNVTKISLSTFFLILAIIAIIVMGIFIYKLNNDKTAEIQKSTELQSQVNSLNGTVSDLQGKINNISETINTNAAKENTASHNEVSNTNNSVLPNETSNAKIKEKDYEDIILNGDYMQGEAGDEVWIFSKDNKVSHILVTSNFKGTYKTIGKNMIEVHFTEEERDDIDNPPKKDTYTVDKYYKISIKDNNTIKIVDTSQELHKSTN